MVELLSKLLIKDYKNTSDGDVRRAYGTLVSVLGLILNVILFGAKFAVGVLTGSVAIRADAINNLSDAGSQMLSFISFRISSKPADREHPFGHGRIEYVVSLIVSFLICWWNPFRRSSLPSPPPEAGFRLVFLADRFSSSFGSRILIPGSASGSIPLS